jgi:hypothetical protein
VFEQETLQRPAELWLDHDEPPFVVARIAPSRPTEKQVDVLGQEMSESQSEVPELWLDHDEPPFVVARIVPELPTTKQLKALEQETPSR